MECFITSNFDIDRAKTKFRMCSEKIAMNVSLLYCIFNRGNRKCVSVTKMEGDR